MSGDEPARLTHLDFAGRATMVDVGDKPITERWASAEGYVRVSAALERAIREQTLRKGDLLGVCRLAGIMAAKRAHELIPLCHPLPLDDVSVEAQVQPGRVRIFATARARARTGVEMEALTAVAVAALTVIDMGKAIDRRMVVEGVRVLEKHGGRSGPFVAGDPAAGGGAP